MFPRDECGARPYPPRAPASAASRSRRPQGRVERGAGCVEAGVQREHLRRPGEVVGRDVRRPRVLVLRRDRPLLPHRRRERVEPGLRGIRPRALLSELPLALFQEELSVSERHTHRRQRGEPSGVAIVPLARGLDSVVGDQL